MSFHGLPCWYELSTDDVEGAQVFYTAILGWDIADSGTPGMDYRVAKLGDTMVAGMMNSDSPAQPPAWVIYFAVDSADATCTAATAGGATALVPPTDIPGTGRFAMLLDPQGAAFGILQPLPGGQGGAFDQSRRGTGNWHEITTPDSAAAIEFYTRLFGWTLVRTVPLGTMDYHILGLKGVEIVGAFSMTGVPTMWKAYFGVASVNASVTAVTQAHGTVLRGPDPIPGGVFTVQITDPQGAALALTGPG
ncbi:MAG: VOC family protein [Candidatus Saccharibacteria bacterium]|nr:VOC family protein [Pseudorhodobacter sp.]